MSELFDFGFTAVDEDELSAVQQTAALASDAEQLATTTQERLDNHYNFYDGERYSCTVSK